MSNASAEPDPAKAAEANASATKAPTPAPPARASKITSDRHLWEIRWVRDLMYLVAVVAFFWFARRVQPILAPVLIGLALAYILNPVVTFLHRRFRLPRWAGTGVIVVGAMFVFLCVLAYVAPLLVRQTSELIDRAPTYRQKLSTRAGPMLRDLAESAHRTLDSFLPANISARRGAPAEGEDISDDSVRDAAADPRGKDLAPVVVPAPPTKSTATAPRSAAGEPNPQVSPIVASVLTWSGLPSVLAPSLSITFTYAFMAISLVGYLALAAVLIIFCFIIFSWKFQSLIDWFKAFVPAVHRERTFAIVGRMDATVSAFIRGRLIQVTLLSTNLAILWWLAGVPFWALLAIFAGILNLVPYLSFIAWPIAVLLVWIDTSTSGGAVTFAGVLLWPSLAFILPQQLDNWVVEPLVQGKATSLDPLSVLLAVLIGGTLLGLVGMILAIPTTACIKILAQEVVLPYLRRKADAWTAE